MKKTTRILAMVLALALVISIAPQNAAAAVGATAEDGNEYTIEQAALQLVTDKAAGKYKLIDTDTLKKWVDKKADIVIVDTMPEAFDKTQHIDGAINAEVAIKEEDVTADQKKALLKAVKKACTETTTKKVKKNGKTTTKKVTAVNYNKKVVVYCGYVKCRRSHWASKYLVEKGFKNVYRYAGGIYAWTDAGNEVVATEDTAATN